jgi:hypothetical protein
MDLEFEIKTITHNIDVVSVNVNISLMVFIKALYPTYSHDSESLKASV